MEKDFVIEYIKKKNYWWTTREIDETDRGIERRQRDRKERVYRRDNEKSETRENNMPDGYKKIWKDNIAISTG